MTKKENPIVPVFPFFCFHVWLSDISIPESCSFGFGHCSVWSLSFRDVQRGI